MTPRIGALLLVAALPTAIAHAAPNAGRPEPRSTRTGPAPCNASDVGTFNPVLYNSNVAGAEDSAAVVGFSNFACDDSDVILGGQTNTIAGNGFAADSFIGAGDTNTIDNSTGSLSPGAFIGGGQNAIVSVGNSAVAAGNADVVTAGQAFAGAGQNNAVGGGYAAVLAGSANSAPAYTSFVGAGYLNSSLGDGSFVGGGQYQASSASSHIGQTAQGEDSFVGAGDFNAATGLQSFVGAGVSNLAPGGDAFVGGGDGNRATAGYAFVGAGVKNVAGGYDAFAGAGYANEANAGSSFIGAGGSLYFAGTVSRPNAIAKTGIDSFIGAGDGNGIGSTAAFVGGGVLNTISAPSTALQRSGDAAFGAIGGGYGNSIVSSAGANGEFSSVGGGKVNVIGAPYAAIAGGHSNSAGGAYASVPGGTNNSANGGASFAAGTGSSAASQGAFVWSDAAGGAKALQSSAANEFLVRASGGVTIYSNAGLTSGVSVAAGSGTWASLSDRGAKTHIVALDDGEILAKLAQLPVTEWSYRSEDARVRHAGPMAQDFRAAFGLGEDDRHIATIDESGVALAALKALAANSRRAFAEAHRLGNGLDDFQAWDDARFAAISRKISRLEAAVRNR